MTSKSCDEKKSIEIQSNDKHGFTQQKDEQHHIEINPINISIFVKQ